MLTKIERAILANQYKILALLDPEMRETWEHLVEALKMGFVSHYEHTLQKEIFDEMSLDDCSFVRQVLDMYDVLSDFYSSNPAEEELSKVPFSKFSGFSESLERQLVMFTRFIINRCSEFPGQAGRAAVTRNFNSGGATSQIYQAMLEAWKRTGNSRKLTREQVENILMSRDV